MKRPLVVLAAGYVLGEVLALQDNTAVDLGVLAWLCAAAAGILWLLDTGWGVLRPSAPKEKMPVSYTHLDVYKRQFCESCQQKAGCQHDCYGQYDSCCSQV